MNELPLRPVSKWRKYAVSVGGGAVFVLLLGYGIYTVASGDDVPRRRVMEVMAVRLQPPPPPPPPPEKPPEPPKIVEKQQFEEPSDEPEEAQDEAPPAGPLALDAEGSAGGDNFGLGARPGGADFRLGSVGGGGGNRYGRYATLIQDRIGRRLQEQDEFDSSKFQATIKIWLTLTGQIDRVEFMRTSGDGALDRQIQQALSTMAPLPEAPPPEMPQPVIVRIGAAPPGSG